MLCRSHGKVSLEQLAGNITHAPESNPQTGPMENIIARSDQDSPGLYKLDTPSRHHSVQGINFVEQLVARHLERIVAFVRLASEQTSVSFSFLVGTTHGDVQ